MDMPNFGAIPVAPNASLVTGTVQWPAQPGDDEDKPWKPAVTLLVHKARDIGDLANFCADEVGGVISVTLRGRDVKLPRPGTEIRLRVEFRGDEYGGNYYANAEDIEFIDDDD
ncbi:MAG: hypothetical protein JXB47_01380 [Anaerolineae bacterium]|nr:hypothetical protein [Anaerolineae bacterium]